MWHLHSRPALVPPWCVAWLQNIPPGPTSLHFNLPSQSPLVGAWVASGFHRCTQCSAGRPQSSPRDLPIDSPVESSLSARWGGSHCPHPPENPFLGGQTPHGTPAQVVGGKGIFGNTGRSSISDLEGGGGFSEDGVCGRGLKHEGGGRDHG